MFLLFYIYFIDNKMLKDEFVPLSINEEIFDTNFCSHRYPTLNKIFQR